MFELNFSNFKCSGMKHRISHQR